MIANASLILISLGDGQVRCTCPELRCTGIYSYLSNLRCDSSADKNAGKGFCLHC